MDTNQDDTHTPKNSTELLLNQDQRIELEIDNVFCELGQRNSLHSSSEVISHIVAKESLSSCNVCRICYEDDSKEKLISPCKCTGTMGVLHKSCIEEWLGSSNSSKCEICNFEFITIRRPKPLRQWLKKPSHRNDRRNLIGDFVCFCLLTPLAGVSVYLCTNGALTYSKYKNYTWEIVGLVVLSVFLVCIYVVWVTIAIRYHSRVLSDWRNKNQQVLVINFNDIGPNKSQSSFLSLDIVSSEGNSQNWFDVNNPNLREVRSSSEIAASSHAVSMPQDIPLRYLSSGQTSHSLPEGTKEKIIMLSTHPDIGSYLDKYTPSTVSRSGILITPKQSTDHENTINNKLVHVDTVDKTLSGSKLKSLTDEAYLGTVSVCFSGCDISQVHVNKCSA